LLAHCQRLSVLSFCKIRVSARVQKGQTNQQRAHFECRNERKMERQKKTWRENRRQRQRRPNPPSTKKKIKEATRKNDRLTG